MKGSQNFKAIVIGASVGGMLALEKVLTKLSAEIPVPVFVVQHLSPDVGSYLKQHLARKSKLTVSEAEDKGVPAPGHVYLAPPNYHLLIEHDRTMSLTVDPKVNYSRPSVDVLFETAAEVYADKLIGVILTGANSDGAKGLAKIKRFGGMAIVQSPETAEADMMPRAAIEASDVDHILQLDEIGGFLNTLLQGGSK